MNGHLNPISDNRGIEGPFIAPRDIKSCDPFFGLFSPFLIYPSLSTRFLDWTQVYHRLSSPAARYLRGLGLT